MLYNQRISYNVMFTTSFSYYYVPGLSLTCSNYPFQRFPKNYPFFILFTHHWLPIIPMHIVPLLYQSVCLASHRLMVSGRIFSQLLTVGCTGKAGFGVSSREGPLLRQQQVALGRPDSALAVGCMHWEGLLHFRLHWAIRLGLGSDQATAKQVISTIPVMVCCRPSRQSNRLQSSTSGFESPPGSFLTKVSIIFNIMGH